MSLVAPPLSAASIAMNRFGLGVRPNDAVPNDPKRWLIEQLQRFDVQAPAMQALDDPGILIQLYRDQRAALTSGGASTLGRDDTEITAQEAHRAFEKRFGGLYASAVQARVTTALATDTPFVERMVHFWANHFCVSADSPRLGAYVGTFERDVIRPHVLGTFGDMLLAAERHPAMLMFLNQADSVGPNSPAALRDPARRRGLNENLGREILELHTLGVRSGYTQADVTELSRALTGWGIGPPDPSTVREGHAEEFLFRPPRHEPGPRLVLGKSYVETGDDQARAILTDIAGAPATMNHVAAKLARHFAGDDPPPALVRRLVTTFKAKGGDLPSLYRTLIDSPEPWATSPLKFKMPWEWAISALRGMGRRDAEGTNMTVVMAQLSQPVWRPGSPAGWDDLATSWMGPDVLMRRVEVAGRFARSLGRGIDARTLAPRLTPASMGQRTMAQISDAESPDSATALMLVAPEFLRR